MEFCYSQAAGRSRRPLQPSLPCCVSSWGAEMRPRRVSRCFDPFLPRFSLTPAPALQPARVWVHRMFSSSGPSFSFLEADFSLLSSSVCQSSGDVLLRVCRWRRRGEHSSPSQHRVRDAQSSGSSLNNVHCPLLPPRTWSSRWLCWRASSCLLTRTEREHFPRPNLEAQACTAPPCRPGRCSSPSVRHQN